jgi:AcrR family transcriptional regulator
MSERLVKFILWRVGRVTTMEDKADMLPVGERSERRRHQIVEAAVGLFAAKGFHSTTVRDIARKVGVSVGLLYVYFPSKDEILASACEQVARDVARSARAAVRGAEGPADRLRVCFGSLVQAVDRSSDLHLIIYRESRSLPRQTLRRITAAEQQVVDLLASILDEGVESGVFVPGDNRLRAQTFAFVAHMWALKRWSLRDRLSVEGFCEQELRAFLDGLVPQEGRVRRGGEGDARRP